MDQNGYPIHPATSLYGLADGQWYHRPFEIGNKAGQTLSGFKIAHEGDAAGVYLIKLDNILIKCQAENKMSTKQELKKSTFQDLILSSHLLPEFFKIR